VEERDGPVDWAAEDEGRERGDQSRVPVWLRRVV